MVMVLVMVNGTSKHKHDMVNMQEVFSGHTVYTFEGRFIGTML
jgi:hypothetical protein